MSTTTDILVADDDPHIREVVRFAAEQAGFGVEEAADGAETLECIEAFAPDLVVLDIMMPEMDGTDVCRQVRKESELPIIFLSSRDEEVDRVVGLELGGDDYVTKPFSPRELVARIKAVLRRSGSEADGEAVEASDASTDRETSRLEHGRLVLDLDRIVAFWGDREVALTKTEFRIVRTMMGYPGKVFSRDELMDGAYDRGVVVSDRTIDSHVRKARKKFAEVGAEPIETVHGMGYKLGACT